MYGNALNTLTMLRSLGDATCFWYGNPVANCSKRLLTTFSCAAAPPSTAATLSLRVHGPTGVWQRIEHPHHAAQTMRDVFSVVILYRTASKRAEAVGHRIDILKTSCIACATLLGRSMRSQPSVGPCTSKERVAAVVGGAAAHKKVVKRRFEQFATGLPYQKHVASPAQHC
jgi:hypothetical protein